MIEGKDYDALLKKVYPKTLKDMKRPRDYFSKIRSKLKKIKKRNSEHYTPKKD